MLVFFSFCTEIKFLDSICILIAASFVFFALLVKLYIHVTVHRNGFRFK